MPNEFLDSAQGIGNTAGFSMLPKKFAWAVLWLNIGICILAVVVGLYEGHGPSHQFDEGRISTFLSCAILLATAACAWMTMLERRRETGWSGWKTPWLVWFFLGGAFVYLAADDALRFHELIDKIIHQQLHITETGVTDRLDDVIVGLYAMAGLGLLYVYRRELMLVRASYPYWVWGFAFTFVQVIFDALGDGEDALGLVFHDPVRLRNARIAMELAEGVTEAIAEGFFLSAFYCSAFLTRQRRLREANGR